MAQKTILDVCCGSKMMWFSKDDPRVIFLDKRQESLKYIGGVSEGRTGQELEINVSPNILSDFTKLPFKEDTFSLVVFDPPHFSKIGSTSRTAKKYGKLPPNWKIMLRDGFSECFRVLRPDGVLVFKWNEYEIPLSEILSLTNEKPLFGNRFGRASMTHWVAFTKPNKACTRPPMADGMHSTIPLQGSFLADDLPATIGGR